MEFKPWPKIPRFSRDIIVTEKLDGTNAQVSIFPVNTFADSTTGAIGVFDGNVVFAGSRNRWVQPGNDNYGFAAWVQANVMDLLNLGPGSHFGEWWGNGIQRGYGLSKKRFSLFNASRWKESFLGKGVFEVIKATDDEPTFSRSGPSCCSVVPVLYEGPFDQEKIEEQILLLKGQGSVAAPAFMDPEGLIVFHTASGQMFKKTCRDDDKRKTEQ